MAPRKKVGKLHEMALSEDAVYHPHALSRYEMFGDGDDDQSVYEYVQSEIPQPPGRRTYRPVRMRVRIPESGGGEDYVVPVDLENPLWYKQLAGDLLTLVKSEGIDRPGGTVHLSAHDGTRIETLPALQLYSVDHMNLLPDDEPMSDDDPLAIAIGWALSGHTDEEIQAALSRLPGDAAAREAVQRRWPYIAGRVRDKWVDYRRHHTAQETANRDCSADFREWVAHMSADGIAANRIPVAAVVPQGRPVLIPIGAPAPASVPPPLIPIGEALDRQYDVGAALPPLIPLKSEGVPDDIPALIPIGEALDRQYDVGAALPPLVPLKSEEVQDDMPALIPLYTGAATTTSTAEDEDEGEDEDAAPVGHMAPPATPTWNRLLQHYRKMRPRRDGYNHRVVFELEDPRKLRMLADQLQFPRRFCKLMGAFVAERKKAHEPPHHMCGIQMDNASQMTIAPLDGVPGKFSGVLLNEDGDTTGTKWKIGVGVPETADEFRYVLEEKL